LFSRSHANDSVSENPSTFCQQNHGQNAATLSMC
jgi:hypothetical protein